MKHSVFLTTLTAAVLLAAQIASAQPGRGGNFTTSPEPDTQAPLFVDGPSPVSVFATSAVIQWTSDEAAGATVRLTTANGAEVTTVHALDFTTHHGVALTGLTAGVAYTAELLMVDPSGNTSEMALVLFTTYGGGRDGNFSTSPVPDTFFPVYTSPPILLDIRDVAATLEWESDEMASAIIRYGTSEGSLNGTIYSADMVTSHRVELSGLQPGVVYYVRIEMFDPSGNGPTVENVQFKTRDEAPLRTERTGPSAFALHQNAPNPFNPSTTISFSLPNAGRAVMTIYNAGGQLVRTLVDGPISAGAHSATWNGLDASGRPVAGGVYIYRLEWNGPADRMVSTRALTLVR